MRARKFNDPNSKYGDTTLKQHAFIEKTIMHPYLGEYRGVKSMCGKVVISENNETSLPLDKIRDLPFVFNIACKNCLKIYLKKRSEWKDNERNEFLKRYK